MEAFGTFNADVQPLTVWRPSVRSGKKNAFLTTSSFLTGFPPISREMTKNEFCNTKGVLWPPYCLSLPWNCGWLTFQERGQFNLERVLGK